ncbi:helix-turn-helix domain-containing protein [Neobacillus sp. Marseille-QA0830]
MKYDLTINNLSKWGKDESLYRKYSQLKDNTKALNEFLEAIHDEPELKDIMVHPENIPQYRYEDKFISNNHNVAIIKHPRFIPFFFHEHSFFEIVYILSGACKQRMRGKTFTFVQGDLCLIPPNVEHGIEVFDDSLILNILIRRSTFLDIFINTIRHKTEISFFFLENIYSRQKVRYLIYHTNGDVLIRNYILDMYLEQLNTDEYSDRIICSILTIFFMQLTRRHKKSLEIPEVNQKGKAYENQFLNYILNNYPTVTLKELSEHFNFSVPYCSKLIKSLTGYSFSELLTSIRMQQGESLLLLTQLSMAEISDKVGCEHPDTFIRAFKRNFGTSPSQYRKSKH